MGVVADGARVSDEVVAATGQIAVELGEGHAAYFRYFLLVDVQLARLNTGQVDLAPFALTAAVA